MNIAEYIQSSGITVAQLAREIGLKNDMQLRQWMHGYANRKPGPRYCVALEQATSGKITRQDLRPHDYHLIWPELKKEVA